MVIVNITRKPKSFIDSLRVRVEPEQSWEYIQYWRWEVGEDGVSSESLHGTGRQTQAITNKRSLGEECKKEKARRGTVVKTWRWVWGPDSGSWKLRGDPLRLFRRERTIGSRQNMWKMCRRVLAWGLALCGYFVVYCGSVRTNAAHCGPHGLFTSMITPSIQQNIRWLGFYAQKLILSLAWENRRPVDFPTYLQGLLDSDWLHRKANFWARGPHAYWS